MKVEISVFVICVLVFIVNTILDHLANWWMRDAVKWEDADAGTVIALLYLLKSALIIIGLNYITK